MTHTQIEMTEDEFAARYPLLPNHINPTAGWSVGEKGCLFETYGDEFDYVRRFDPRRIWTLIDGGEDCVYVVSGLHLVNRVGYLLSRSSVPSGVSIEVRIQTPGDER